MQHTWDEFRKAYENEQVARLNFCDLCEDLMRLKYPDHNIFKSADILETDKKKVDTNGKTSVIYLPKFFTDGVSNSRKGQIRKSLNDNLPFMQVNDIKKWVLFVPTKLSTEESSWWDNWTSRITKETGTELTIYDSKAIFALLNDFKITGKWFESEHEYTSKIEADDLLDFALDIEAAGSEPKAEPETHTTTTTTTTTVTTQTVKTVSAPRPIAEAMAAQMAAAPVAAAAPIAATASNSEEPTIEQLVNTFKFKQLFEELELLHKTSLNQKQREIFDRRREESKVANYLNDFEFGDLSNTSLSDLIYKADAYSAKSQYSRALYIYEYINFKGNVAADRKDEIDTGIAENCENLQFMYKMMKGDLLFATRDYINAYEEYEEAAELKDGENAEANSKKFEAQGEALLEVGDFANAADCFKTALNYNVADDNLKKRYEIAKSLDKGTNFFKNKWLRWLNIFIAPFAYWNARRKDPNISENAHAKKLRRKAWWGVITVLLLLLGVAAIFFIGKFIADKTTQPEIETQALQTPQELQISLGDYYMANFSNENPHYIDSAITAYKRAIRYDNTDTATQRKYRNAENRRIAYINEVQNNINNDTTYFLSMRRPTEGLWLFKYRYDKSDLSKGKFGYADTTGKIVIAPMFDFNYRKMEGAGETFCNGKALVCLKVGQDTIYFHIDNRGNKIEEEE
ncbi:MAG: hypothetical protein J5882_03645 [Bacteroidales bacterium]|nr:hypothetical protein [Bacteroidales bacterium]